MIIDTGITQRFGPDQRHRHQADLATRTYRLHSLHGNEEQGTALIFALVMLLLLTILGITAITTSSLQEKMAGNMRDQYMAQQAGDSILLAGQAWVFNQKTKPVPSCPPTAGPTGEIWDSTCLPAAVALAVGAPAGPNWWLTADDPWWTGNGRVSTVATLQTSQEPRFVVERVQQVPLDPSASKTVYRYYFRSTGWAVGASDASRGLFQDIFSKRSDTYVN